MAKSKKEKKHQPELEPEAEASTIEAHREPESERDYVEDGKFTIELIRVLYRLIRKTGLETMIDSLKQVDYNAQNEKDDVDFIIGCVCNKTKVSREMLSDRKRRGDVAVARKYVILFLRKYTKISDAQACFYIKRSRQVLFNAEKEFSKLDPNNKFDAKFLKVYNIIDAELQKRFVEQSQEQAIPN